MTPVPSSADPPVALPREPPEEAAAACGQRAPHRASIERTAVDTVNGSCTHGKQTGTGRAAARRRSGRGRHGAPVHAGAGLAVCSVSTVEDRTADRPTPRAPALRRPVPRGTPDRLRQALREEVVADARGVILAGCQAEVRDAVTSPNAQLSVPRKI